MQVFISMPMNGKTREEIIARREEIKEILLTKFEDVELINSLMPEDWGPIWCLGGAIQLMQDADLVVFDKGWRDARGCKVEYDVCSYYGLKFMELK